MFRRVFNRFFAGLTVISTLVLGANPVFAADEAPDGMIQRLSTDVLNTIKADKSLQSGNLARIVALVDNKIMPSVNFQRMTASAVGPNWRKTSRTCACWWKPPAAAR